MEAELNSPERLRWEAKQLVRARRGDSAGFGELYREYAPRIFSRVLLPKLGERSAAEDALAETFKAGFERLHQFHAQERSIYYWFSRIAANKATDMFRARGVTGRALVNLQEQLGPLLELPIEPDSALDYKREYGLVRARLRDALAALNERYRLAIELRFIQGKSREKCAEEMAVKLGTFDVVLLRALKSLRKAWDVNMAEPGRKEQHG